mmetsp:Transcript_25105/g.47764  ORF Transcript_25105/g.47764 Transcript_25105/m.47764 type:complete len:124 (+) Transcript_25105:178-549(+)
MGSPSNANRTAMGAALAVVMLVWSRCATAATIQDQTAYQMCLSSPTSCTTLSLASRSLTGSIPSQLGTFTMLTQLSITRNQVTGSIPTELSALTRLTSLMLNSNQLSGPLHNSIGTLTNLRTL